LGIQVAGCLRVGYLLDRRKGFRRDDEKCCLGVNVASGLGEVGAVDVRDETEGQVCISLQNPTTPINQRQQRCAEKHLYDLRYPPEGRNTPRPP